MEKEIPKIFILLQKKKLKNTIIGIFDSTDLWIHDHSAFTREFNSYFYNLFNQSAKVAFSEIYATMSSLLLPK